VNFACYIPVFLFILPAAYLADTRDRKRVVLASFALMLASALALGVTSSAGVASLAVIVVAVFANGTAYTATLPAALSLLPMLVPKEDTLNAIALTSAQYNIGRVAGAALGGLVIGAWSVTAAFYLNAASFVFVLVAVSLVRTSFKAETAPDTRMYEHIAAGFRHVIERKWMVAALLTYGIATFFG
jgi:MFS family permease